MGFAVGEDEGFSVGVEVGLVVVGFDVGFSVVGLLLGPEVGDCEGATP